MSDASMPHEMTQKPNVQDGSDIAKVINNFTSVLSEICDE